MSRAVLILANDRLREKAAAWCAKLPQFSRVEFKAPKRTIPQNDRMWAMLTEIAAQVEWRDLLGRPLKMTTDQWKVFFLDMLNREALLVPNAEGTGYVNLGRSSSDLGKAEMSDLIELLFVFGAQHDVTFSEGSAT